MSGIVVKNLSIVRAGVRVLADLSFEVRPGTALTLRGPNGIGKTTLLRTLAGLQLPAEGEINVNRDEVVYASHADGLKPTLSVTENLHFWAGIFGHASINHALERFDLIALQERPAGLLSAGQKRRLGLARLLVSGRNIWLLDEPTVSLDVQAVAQFANAVEAHLQGGGCALIATHIDLGIKAKSLDLSPFRDRARAHMHADDEAYL